MAIIEPAIRPPAEAYSFLLQITTGCSSNHCSFCGAYLNKQFRIKDYEEVAADIGEGAQLWPDTRRVFLMDGDALVVPDDKLLKIIRLLNSSFPALSRISSYANGYNITKRSLESLKRLRDNKLKLMYIGLESGSQKVLDLTGKRSSAIEMVEAVKKAREAGIKSSVIVLLGLGGKEHSLEHARETITALNEMQPELLSFLTVMLVPGTRLFNEANTGRFTELEPYELLTEMNEIISGLELKKTVFRSDHASNYLPLDGRFPHDKSRIIKTLELALRGERCLRPDNIRGL